jgi:hypothetical protein
MIIQLPFSGFYDSWHGQCLNDEVFNSMFTDYATGCENNDKLSDIAYDLINWLDVHTDYAREYVKNFNSEFNLNLTFESLQSPREYNFATDRIFAEISVQEIHKLFENVKVELLEKNAREMFASRDGFSSFYNPDWTTWGDVLTWDHNQLHCLIYAFLEQYSNNVDGEFNDYNLMEASFCNGFLSEVICKNAPGIERLLKIHDRLNRKAA